MLFEAIVLITVLFEKKKTLLALTLIFAPGIALHLCYPELSSVPNSVVADAALKSTALLQPVYFAYPIQHIFCILPLLVSTGGKRRILFCLYSKTKKSI